MSMSIPLSIIVLHFIGDWVLQSNWMALNKGKDAIALAAHVVVVGTTLLIGMLLLGYELELAYAFMAYNMLAHFVTDMMTPNITSYFWFVRVIEPVNGPGSKFYGAYDMPKRHWFFVAIGADQLIHYATYAYFWRVVFP